MPSYRLIRCIQTYICHLCRSLRDMSCQTPGDNRAHPEGAVGRSTWRTAGTTQGKVLASGCMHLDCFHAHMHAAHAVPVFHPHSISPKQPLLVMNPCRHVSFFCPVQIHGSDSGVFMPLHAVRFWVRAHRCATRTRSRAASRTCATACPWTWASLHALLLTASTPSTSPSHVSAQHAVTIRFHRVCFTVLGCTALYCTGCGCSGM